MYEFQKKVKEIQEKIKAKSLVINRIPKNIRDEFTKLAEEEFCDDYGALLKWCFEQALEYQRIKKILLNKELIKEILKCYASIVEKK